MAELSMWVAWAKVEMTNARRAVVASTFGLLQDSPMETHWAEDEHQEPSITCPKCGMTSYHPEDIRYGYCGNCSAYTSSEAGLP